MVKRTFIPAKRHHHPLKIYVDDLKKIHKYQKKKTPRLPSYEGNQLTPKWE